MPEPHSSDHKVNTGSKRKRANPVPPGLEGGRYKPLTKTDIHRIHDAALTVLERTGVSVVESEARRILEAGGARVDRSNDRVFIPRDMLERTLKTANRKVVLYSKNGVTDLHLGRHRVHLGTGGSAVKIYDPENGQLREPNLRDNYDIGRLVESLDNIHFYLRPVVPCEVPKEDIDINIFYTSLAATNKHVMGGCYLPEKVADIKRLGVMIAGGEEEFLARPFLSLNLGFMISPLHFAPETVETLTIAVRAGIPVVLVCAPQAGSTSPTSLVGTLVQVIAEALAGVTYVGLLRQGHPLLFGAMPIASDLRTGNAIGGSAEIALMNAATAQIANFYGLPIYNSSALTDSKIPDVQAGYEKGLSTVVTALAGSQFIHHSAGMLESMLAVAYEQYVIDDDINGQAMRLVRGLEVTDESLSLDVIHEVCTGPGHYLGHKQTRALMKSEYHYPHTADRGLRSKWEAEGGLDMRSRARRKVQQTLRSFFPQVLSADLDQRIRDQFNILLPREVMLPGGYP